MATNDVQLTKRTESSTTNTDMDLKHWNNFSMTLIAVANQCPVK